eukprot:135845_1
MASNRKRNLSEISNDNDTEYEHHDGNWGTYIGNKRRKLINQFRENINIKSNLFCNHIIWINGRTNPPLSELKELIISNGGIAVTTLTNATTIIIADNLPMTKLKQLNKIKSNIIVCTPQWILKSIESNKLLNPNNFPLSNFKNKINKNSLKNYQTHNNKNIQNKQDTVTETDENEHNKF